MRHRSLFYRLFPPPKFLTMTHAGLEISDDAIRCIQYRVTAHGLSVERYDRMELSPNIIENGDIKDERAFLDILKSFVKKNKLSFVRVSLPEEKVYLFQTDIPSLNVREITQHVEFKLEENVPLPASEAIFYFDILPLSATGGSLRASVSVAPKVYVQKLFSLLHEVGLVPVAFEVAPKSIAKAVVPQNSSEACLIVHIMKRKTGTYIVCGGVVCFSSTIAWGSEASAEGAGKSGVDIIPLSREIRRVYEYWQSRPDNRSALSRSIIIGEGAAAVEQQFRDNPISGVPQIVTPDIWQNAFDIRKYIPAISREASFEYTVAAGLALT